MKKISLIIFYLVAVISYVKAQHTDFNGYVDGNTINDAILNNTNTVIVDINGINVPAECPYGNIIESKGLVSFYSNDRVWVGDTVTVTLKVTVTYHQGGGVVVENYDYKLQLNNEKGQTVQSKQTYNYTAPSGVNQLNKITLDFTEIRVNNSTYTVGDVLKHIEFEGVLRIQRELLMNSTSIISGITKSYENDNLTVSWDMDCSDDLYDIEWTFIDNYGSSFNPSTNIVSFKENSGRARVKTNEFTFPLVYEKGYLFYRVRKVHKGIDANKVERIYTSDWSADDDKTISQYTSSYTTQYHQQTTPHESDGKNWQVTSSFAEDGKRKDVVTYADGLGLARQTVTKVNTQNESVIANTYYDHIRRPVLNVLPSPVSTNQLKHFPGYDTESGNSIKYTDYDVSIIGDLCSPTVTLDSISGAGQYYSSNQTQNPYNPNVIIDHLQERTPTAQGFPYTQTVYTQDLTNRPLAQSGVGKFHTLGSQHETKYMYEKVDQNDIDKLFGNNVGWSKFYRKNLVKDPNGQISVTYTDLGGKTVATGLSGPPPTGLDALPSYNPDNITKIILTGNPSKDNQQTTLTSVSTSYPFVVVSNDPVEITYKIKDTSYIYDCPSLSLCKTCNYKLRIELIGPCGTIIDSIVENIEGDINACQTFNTHNYTITLDGSHDLGQYILNKRLEVDMNHLYANVDSIMWQGLTPDCDCIKDTSCFEIIGDPNACSPPDCADCYFPELIQQQLLNAGYGWVDTAQIKEDCFAACGQADSAGTDRGKCEGELQMMITDINPGGQYGLYYIGFDGIEIMDSFKLSVFYEDNLLNGSWKDIEEYYDKDGSVSIIENSSGIPIAVTQANIIAGYITLQMFIDNFKSTWAEQLVLFHPEYCYYEFCLENETDYELYEFIEKLNEADTWEEALDSFPGLCLGNLGTIWLHDPMSTSTYESIYYDDIHFRIYEQQMQYYDNFNGEYFNWSKIQQWFSLMVTWGAKDLISKKKKKKVRDLTNEYITNSSTCGTGGTDKKKKWDFWFKKRLDEEQRDMIWEIFKADYINARNAAMNSRKHRYAIENGCFNGCIGFELSEYFPQDENGNIDTDITDDYEPGSVAIRDDEAYEEVSEAIEENDDESQNNNSNGLEPWQLDYYDLPTFDASYIFDTVNTQTCGDLDAQYYFNRDTFYVEGTDTVRLFRKQKRIIDQNDVILSLTGVDPRSVDPDDPAAQGEFVQTLFDNLYDFASTIEENIKPYVFCSGPDGNPYVPEVIPTRYQTDLMLNNIEVVTALNVAELTHDYTESAVEPQQDTICGVYVAYPAEYGGLSHTAIAQLAGVSPSNIESYWRNATAITNPRFFKDPGKILDTLGMPDSLDFSFVKIVEVNIILNGCEFPTEMLVYCDACLEGEVAIEIVDSCESWYETELVYQQLDQYQRYLDSIKQQITFDYLATCMNALENMNTQTTDQEYHYTLYYYDQAGNLVQTVPPAGVVYLDNSQIAQVQNYRDNGVGSPIYNEHDKTTHYRYTSLNQVRQQYTPDGGESLFYYDDLGRLIASKNAQQDIDNTFSYTEYDLLGRITEVGQAQGSLPSGNGFTYGTLPTSVPKSQITRTIYDTIYNPSVQPHFNYNEQQNLRNRVSTALYFENEIDTTPITATYYSYDALGNVNELIHEYPQYASAKQDIKKIEYEYDLVSGNVNKVLYQRDKKDQFYHSYLYDADNRITDVFTTSHTPVFTGKDDKFWDKDATYHYYRHGPLARTELGEKSVQGIDYTYTIQGWLKQVNGHLYKSKYDQSKDGYESSPFAQNTARDIYGFKLGYFENDYTSITGVSLENEEDGSVFSVDAPNLFNGNIRTMVTNNVPLEETDSIYNLNHAKAMSYNYDQLNRITYSNAYFNYDTTAHQWGTSYNASETGFKTNYTYDADGNLQTLNRYKDNTTDPFDSLIYYYENNKNRLMYVDDNASSAAETADIDDQNAYNYAYDAIGNLIGDKSEGIAEIEWTVYGKVKRVIKETGDTITYTYDAMGNRIIKDVNGAQTLYTRDASGNIMATYSVNTNDSVVSSQLIEGSVSNGIEEIEVTYTNIVGCTVDIDGNLMKTAGNGWSNAGAFSEETILQGEYLEWTPCASSGLNQQVSLGLSYVDANQHYASIKNMWHHYNATTYRIFESGSYKTNYTGQPVGLKMRVSREKDGGNDYIRYYLGGVLKRTIPDPNPTAPMYADISIYRTNTGVCDLKIGKITTIETDTIRYYVKDGNTFIMNEHHLYGSSRLGMEQKNEFLAFSGNNVTIDSLHTTTYRYNDTTLNATYLGNTTEVEDTTFTEPDSIWTKTLGWKKYELSNHLGNVMVVISDRKLGVDSTGGDAANYYIADAINATDYYPFGMTMPGRQYTGNQGYRFGYNTQEKTDEISGAGNHYTAEFWEYNTRVVQRWNLDPKPNTSYSLYSVMQGNPIWYSDFLGDSVTTNFNNNSNQEAFMQFSSTKGGRKFLAKYAAAGQTIGDYTFEKSGKFHEKGIDVNYTDEILKNNRLGETRGGENGGIFKEGRLKLSVVLTTDWNSYAPVETNDETIDYPRMNYEMNLNTGDLLSVKKAKAILMFSIAKTIVHESLLHVNSITKDYIDDKKINYSHFTSEYLKIMPSARDHKYFRSNYQTEPFYLEGVSILGEINQRNGLKMSNQKIVNNIWRFNDY